MPRFLHIDHCLCHYGGHEFDYAVNVLEAAEAVGYDVALATHRGFRDHSQLPSRWPVYPVFPFTTYNKHCFWYGGHDHLPVGLDGHSRPDGLRGGNRTTPAALLSGAIKGLAGYPQRLDRRRSLHGFARACRRLFEQVRLGEEDHVFFATITEFDILGLARYLQDHPYSRIANWHLQFHFGLYGGCGPEDTVREERWRKVRCQFESALGHMPSDKVGLYNTTEQLAVQYNHLDVGQFRYVPYPVSPSFERGMALRGGPLRVTCAGAARRDKRIRSLKEIAAALRNAPFFHQKLELAAQLPAKKARRLGIPPDAGQDDLADVPFVAVPHPLERTAYHELIRRTDIGLFLHDRRRYFAQCSGVLHEMLAAGKPVIVPGGCWLADQIAGPISDHIEGLCATLPTVSYVAGAHLQWRHVGAGPAVPLSRDASSFSDCRAVATQLSVPQPATEAVIRFHRAGTEPGGTYVHVKLNQLDDAGQIVGRFESIVGRQQAVDCTATLFHVDPRATRFSLRLQNPHHDGQIAVRDIQLQFLEVGPDRGCPAGSVGLIAAAPSQVPALLRDMVEHYPHYRESAEAFSLSWCQAHHPSRTLEILTGRSTVARAAAA